MTCSLMYGPVGVLSVLLMGDWLGHATPHFVGDDAEEGSGRVRWSCGLCTKMQRE